VRNQDRWNIPSFRPIIYSPSLIFCSWNITSINREIQTNKRWCISQIIRNNIKNKKGGKQIIKGLRNISGLSHSWKLAQAKMFCPRLIKSILGIFLSIVGYLNTHLLCLEVDFQCIKFARRLYICYYPKTMIGWAIISHYEKQTRLKSFPTSFREEDWPNLKRNILAILWDI